jgi:acyl-[acyl-carrier-protein]-phospholipid O-acyltransferase / long-chain-fatty-acid--[acyl-carrier-protein] ligase
MEFDALSLPTRKYGLFLRRRFLPIFLSTFLGAFNDNLLRSGLVVMIAYASINNIELPAPPEILVTICSALLVMPLLFFSSIAGTLADKYEKSRLVVLAKLAEVGIMIGACIGFYTHDIMLLMCLLFVSGTHTTFYSPIKFSILPDHLRRKELLAANGFMAGGTYLATLLGLIAGGYLVELPGNVIGFTALGIAATGLLASVLIPASKIAHPECQVNWNVWKGSKEVIGYACRDTFIMISIFGISWFLLIGSVFMAQFANYAKSVVHANNEVYIIFLTTFSIGIAIGSLLCDTLLKGEISLHLTRKTSFGISLFTYLMVYTTPVATGGELLDAAGFLDVWQHWLVLASMLMVAICGGIYMVPFYAMLQHRTPAEYRSRIMAASSLSDAVLMTAAALVSAVLLSLGFGITDLFLVVATSNLLVVFYARKLSA